MVDKEWRFSVEFRAIREELWIHSHLEQNVIIRSRPSQRRESHPKEKSKLFQHPKLSLGKQARRGEKYVILREPW